MHSTGQIQTRHIDRRLRVDIRQLGEILGRVLRAQEGDLLFRKVETLRRLTKANRNSGRNVARGNENRAGCAASAGLTGRERGASAG